MKKLFIPMVVLLVLAFVITGCNSATTAPTTNPVSTSATVAPVSTSPSTAAPVSTMPSSTTPATAQPVKGGVLRVATSASPVSLSYYPEMGPGDSQIALPAAEKLADYDDNHQLSPVLATSWDEDFAKKTMTFHLRQGVKFTDGSNLTAEVVAWNYQLAKDTKRLQFSAKLESIEVVDPLTIVLHATVYNNQLIQSWAWVPIFSKAAFDAASNGDAVKGKEWARQNIVATGPFKLKEFKRDVSITWVKNETYWRPGYPLLDGILVSFVPDSSTAANLIQSKQADIWMFGAIPINTQTDLVNKGFVRQSGFGSPGFLMPNTKDATSKWQNQKLREAVEYALDKAAIAKALGSGYYVPMNVMSPPGEWGSDAAPGRPYDVAKAKQLLKDAGYPNGLPIKILAMTQTGGRNTTAEAIKGYLDEAGFQTELDIADSGRFTTMCWRDGWPDLLLYATGLDPNYLITFFRQFGPEPMSNYASLYRSPELLALCEEAYQAQGEANQKVMNAKLVKYIADNELVIPTFFAPSVYIMQTYVHTDFLKQQMVCWYSYRAWMDPH